MLAHGNLCSLEVALLAAGLLPILAGTKQDEEMQCGGKLCCKPLQHGYLLY
jgi:hypothetical protein